MEPLWQLKKEIVRQLIRILSGTAGNVLAFVYLVIYLFWTVYGLS
jgi:hypothetical protein